MGKIEQRVLTHKGIEYDGLLYNCPELTDLRRKLGTKLDVELRVDEGDIGHIYVIAPDKSSIIRVPCLDFEYANGITAWQHSVFKRYAKLNLNFGSTPNAWRHAKVAIAEIIQRDVLKKSTKKKNKTGNDKLARFQNASQPKQDAASGSINALPVVVEVPLSTSQPVVIPATAVTPIAFSPMPRSRPKFEALIEDRSGSFD